MTSDLEERESFMTTLVVYILADNYRAITRRKREAQAKIMTQVRAGEGQSQILF